MSDKLRKFLPVIIVILGVLLLLYPSVSAYLTSQNATRVTANYDTSIEHTVPEERVKALENAVAYNERLYELMGTGAPVSDADGAPDQPDDYWDQLNLSTTGMMAYITIPRLKETMPIYHGTSEEVLQVGIGHVQNTSLPVGGENTHAALSGHRGLPTAALFTDLDALKMGDVFFIKVLDETLVYQVDQIVTVEPHETEALAIVPGRDLVTLITCTPYGINSHRLLVRGTRIPYTEEVVQQAEAAAPAVVIPMQYRHLLMGVAAIAAILIIRWIVVLILRKTKHRRKR